MRWISLSCTAAASFVGSSAGTILFEDEGQRVLISPWGSDSLRLQVVPAGAEFSTYLGALLPLPVQDSMQIGATSITNGNIHAEIDASGRFKVTRLSDNKALLSEAVRVTMTPRQDKVHASYSNASLYEVSASITVGADERHYGLGQHKHGSLHQNGHSMGFQQENTEVFIPFVVSSQEYGYLVNYPGLGNLGWSDGTADWKLKAAEQYDLWVTTTSADSSAPWPAQLMGRYADATGHSPVLPEWASGLWQSKNRYQTQEQLMGVVQEHMDRGLPLSVIVADYFTWSPTHELGDYKFDETCWPDPKGMIDELEDRGVKLMLSPYSQFINNQSVNFPAANASHLLAVNGDGSVVYGYQNSAVFDLYGSEGRGFMADRLAETYLKQGLKVVWHDCDEWCNDMGGQGPADGIYYPSVGSGDAVASGYPGVLSQSWREAFQREGIEDGIMLGRSAWAGTQRFGAAVWSGDIGSNWDSLIMSIPAGQGIGMSGIPWWTTDVGGYGGSHGRAMNVTDPDARELMVRWVQFGAFCPLFRIHGYRSPFPEEPTCAVCTGYSCDQSHETAAWAYGDTAYSAIEKMIHAREALRPYINAQMADISKSGAPFMRPLWFEFPEDPTTMTAEVERTQFMMGPSYLVSVVTKLGAREWPVYLPRGASWRHHFTGVQYEGGQNVTVPAPLDTPPVFQRVDVSVV